MQINLTEQLETYIKNKVESGHYQDESEVIREALRLMEQHEREYNTKLNTLRELIAVGEKQAERGEFSSRTVDEIIADNENRVKNLEQ